MLLAHAVTLAEARSYIAALADEAATFDGSVEYEHALLYLDLIERLPQGRMLTGKGMEHARKLKQEANRA